MRKREEGEKERDVQSTQQKRHRQRQFLNIRNLQLPHLTDRQQQYRKIKRDIANRKRQVEILEKHALGWNRKIPVAMHRDAQENGGYRFGNPPCCDEAEENVCCPSEGGGDEDTAVEEEGGGFDGGRGGDVDFVDCVDGFAEGGQGCGGEGVDVAAGAVDDAWFMCQK